MTDTNSNDSRTEPKNAIENAAENLMQNLGEGVPDGSGSQDHSDPRTRGYSNLAEGLNGSNEGFKPEHEDR